MILRDSAVVQKLNGVDDGGPHRSTRDTVSDVGRLRCLEDGVTITSLPLNVNNAYFEH
jgi:hypothetical protein